MTIVPQEPDGGTKTDRERRALLKKVGRFAAVTALAMTLLLAAQTKFAKALTASTPLNRAFR